MNRHIQGRRKGEGLKRSKEEEWELHYRGIVEGEERPKELEEQSMAEAGQESPRASL